MSKEFVQVTTPLLFKLIPAVVHLGVLLRWFSPDTQSEVIINVRICLLGGCTPGNGLFNHFPFWHDYLLEKFWNFLYFQLGFKGDSLRSDSAKQRIALISKDLLIHEG